MMKQIEMMTESISPYNEIMLFGHGYKRTELERARDQFNDVTVLIKYFSILRSYSIFTTVVAAVG
jgi:hypothetical protein